MSKDDILKFLHAKQKEKEYAIKAEYIALQKQLLRNAYSELGIPALADKIQPLLAEAYRLWEDWKKEHEILNYVHLCHSDYALNNMIKKCTSSKNATFKRIVEEDICVTLDEVRNAYANYKDQQNCVENTFTTVINTVLGMSSAKCAAIYLEELGFDLSELNNPAEQAQIDLTIPVDTQFLFVKTT